MKVSKTKKLVVSALFAALVCIATLVIHIPIPATNGYINLGDCIVLLSGFILGPVWGTAAAAIGSALSDAILGYTLYIPATFIIKGAVALGASALYRFPKTGLLRAPIAGIAGEIIMIIGYTSTRAFSTVLRAQQQAYREMQFRLLRELSCRRHW